MTEQKRRPGRPRKRVDPPPVDGTETRISVGAGDDAEEYVQRKIDIKAPVENKRASGSRVRVYNKLRAKLFTSDGFLLPESEGSILESDMDNPSIRDNCIRLQ